MDLIITIIVHIVVEKNNILYIHYLEYILVKVLNS